MQALKVLANNVLYGARICCNSMSKYGIFSSTLSMSLLQWLFLSGCTHFFKITNLALSMLNYYLQLVFLYELFKWTDEV